MATRDRKINAAAVVNAAAAAAKILEISRIIAVFFLANAAAAENRIDFPVPGDNRETEESQKNSSFKKKTMIQGVFLPEGRQC